MSEELPEGWALAKLGDVAQVKLGKMLDKAKRVTGTHLPYLRNANVRWDGFAVDDLLTMPFLDDEIERFGVEDGDLFVCEGGEPGRCAIWKGGKTNLKFQKAILRVRPRHAVEARWMLYALRAAALNGELEQYFTGTTIKHFPQEAVLRFQFPLAPLAEQRRIVAKVEALLARVNAARDQLEKVPLLMKRFRQSVLATATSGELSSEWRAVREISNGWESVTLGSLLADVRYGTSKKCSPRATKTPVLRIPNVVKGSISHYDLKYAEFDETEREKLGLAPGDLLMIRSNGSVGLVGRVALVSDREKGFLFAGYLIRLRSNTSRVRPAYLALFLASPMSRLLIEHTARSTAGVNNINAEEIKDLPIELPVLEEQDEIVRRVGGLLAMADQLDQQLASAKNLLESITPSILGKAFAGALVPTEAELAREEGRVFESAEELLRRVGTSGTVVPELVAKKGRGQTSMGAPVSPGHRAGSAR
ncbi:MAG: restriction endonuclease subunit S [Deltaproteobacteria bacterium]